MTHPNGQQQVYLIARGDGLFSDAASILAAMTSKGAGFLTMLAQVFTIQKKRAVSEIRFAYPWSFQVTREERPSGD